MDTVKGMIMQSSGRAGYLEDLYEVVQNRLPMYKSTGWGGVPYYSAPSRAGRCICTGILDRLADMYKEEIEVASMFVVPDDAAGCREDLIEAIKLNIIDQKKYSFETLSARFYPFPYSHKKFTQCRHIFIIALLILLGLEEAI